MADLPDRRWVRFDFRLKEFKVLRWTLRVLSLWQPRKACFVERVVYPVLVNMLLFVMLASDIVLVYYNIKNQATTTGVIYVLLAVDLRTYFSHSCGLWYFKRRDLENNMIDFAVDVEFAKHFKKKIKKLNCSAFLSFGFLVSGIELFYNRALLVPSSSLSQDFNFAVVWLNYVSNVYGVGATLSISWVMYLLQTASRIKLLQHGKNYLQWRNTGEDAIFNHFQNYSQRVHKSCNELKYWFVVHNFILILAMPLFMYTFIHTFKSIDRTQSTVPHSILLCYLIYTSAVWILPLVFAEMLQMHEQELNDEVNKFCKLYIQQKLASDDILQNSHDATYTFSSRTEVNNFLSYLRGRKSGFLVGGYNFQLKLSMISFIIGLLALASKIIGG